MGTDLLSGLMELRASFDPSSIQAQELQAAIEELRINYPADPKNWPDHGSVIDRLRKVRNSMNGGEAELQLQRKFDHSRGWENSLSPALFSDEGKA